MRASAAIFALGAVCLMVGCALAQYQTAPAYSNGYKQQQQRKMAPKPQLGSMASGYGNQMQQDKQQDAYEMMMSNAGASNAGSSASSYGRQNKAPMMMMMKQQQQPSATGYGASNSASSPGAMQQAQTGYGATDAMQQENGYASKQQAPKYQEPEHPPMPFAWGYDINDGYGTTQYHKENGDENGKRTGSYGYMDAYGVYRNVYYVADENGFRATVKTNEPGTANEAPADVEWTAEEPPANVFMGNPKSYSKAGSSNSYSSGQSAAAPAAGMEASQYGQSGNEQSSSSQYGSGGAASMAGNENANQQYSSMRLSGAGEGSRASYGMNNKQQQQQQPIMMMMMNAMDKQQYGASSGDMSDVGAAYGAQKMAQTRSKSSRAYNSANSMMMAPKMQQYSASTSSSSRADNSGNDYNQAPSMPDFGTMMMGIASKVQRQEQEMGAGEPDAQQYSTGNQEAMIGQQYGSGSSNMLNSNNNAQQQYGPAAAASSTGASAMDGASTYASTRLQAGSRGSSNYQNAAMASARQNGSSSYGANSMMMTGASGMGAYGAPAMMQQMQPANNMDGYRKSATKTSQAGNQARRY